jgi:hypothetical protein
MKKRKEYHKKWYLNNKEHIREYNKISYIKNREKRINGIKKHQKETNYSLEKTPYQRYIRYIKRRTRLLFPIQNRLCDICKKKAIEHHHNTIPIEFDKFNYVCKDCHLIMDKELNSRSLTLHNALKKRIIRQEAI